MLRTLAIDFNPHQIGLFRKPADSLQKNFEENHIRA